MKHLFKKEIDHIIEGGCVSGLNIDAFFVFLFYLAKRQKRVLVLCDDLLVLESIKRKRFFSNSFYCFPSSLNKNTVPGFQSQYNFYRSETLVGVHEAGEGICFSTKKAANKKSINNKIVFKNFVLRVGSEVDQKFFCETLIDFGFKKTDYVYNQGEYSQRGEIVDVFPINIEQPLRILFNFNTLEQLSFFDVEDQRTTKNLTRFVLYDLLKKTEETGKSLLSFFEWDLIIKTDRKNNHLVLNAGGKNVYIYCYKEAALLLEKGGVLKLHNKKSIEKPIVFYTNKKRIKKLKSIKAKTVPGLIRNSFSIKGRKGVFLPDIVKSEKINTYKPNKNSYLSKANHGDLMVHVSHGVGVFCGLVVRGPKDHEKEYIKLEYRGGGVLYVPTNKADLIHKYIGVGSNPKINQLGNREWSRNILNTKKKIQHLSKFLLEIYKSRKRDRGFVYKKNKKLEKLIKASFPFRETKDQKKAIKDVLLDLSKKEPMDRLICGDVGFGKTEVALRAVVRVAASSKQTLLLCPTTVLSDQHYITAKKRLGPLGISISLLSRFQTKKNQSVSIKKIGVGSVDLIIGTHRLLSDDVYVPFLGLLIIDEEHRFGVKHKEKIRALKSNIDVLSMSATPIPRTLQQSLLGIRNISRIESPPTTRKPINTFVEFFSWERTKGIIEKELLRGGQIYFLHNKVESIDYYVRKLQEYFPNENVNCIHGKQNSKELEKNLFSFFDGKISILVCSTIIESGLDVSNANCMIINNPQNLGLSQLYQLRGRVGRGSRQANCYLLIPKKTKLTESAFKRLKTIERHTSLGSGYRIAENDLNIRGGGFVFGFKQSGEISKVGLEHYNNLLKDSISEKLKTKEQVINIEISFFSKSLIPIYYVVGEEERFLFYSKINKAPNLKAVSKIQEELIDRFGPMPDETINYLNLAKIKIIYRRTFINNLSINENSVLFVLNRKEVSKDFIKKALEYKNQNVKDRRFKESEEGVSFTLFFSRTFDWYENIKKAVNLFIK